MDAQENDNGLPKLGARHKVTDRGDSDSAIYTRDQEKYLKATVKGWSKLDKPTRKAFFKSELPLISSSSDDHANAAVGGWLGAHKQQSGINLYPNYSKKFILPDVQTIRRNTVSPAIMSEAGAIVSGRAIDNVVTEKLQKRLEQLASSVEPSRYANDLQLENKVSHADGCTGVLCNECTASNLISEANKQHNPILNEAAQINSSRKNRSKHLPSFQAPLHRFTGSRLSSSSEHGSATSSASSRRSAINNSGMNQTIAKLCDVVQSLSEKVDMISDNTKKIKTKKRAARSREISFAQSADSESDLSSRSASPKSYKHATTVHREKIRGLFDATEGQSNISAKNTVQPKQSQARERETVAHAASDTVARRRMESAKRSLRELSPRYTFTMPTDLNKQARKNGASCSQFLLNNNRRDPQCSRQPNGFGREPSDGDDDDGEFNDFDLAPVPAMPVLGDHSLGFGSRMSFTQAVNLIPVFSGSPDDLNLFCSSVRRIRDSFGAHLESFLIMALANKLSGKAADGYRSRLTSYVSIESLLSDLTMQYGNIGIADEVQAQIKVLKQNAGEPVGEFGLRMQKLHNRLLTIIESAPDLGISDRRARKRYADDEALQQFSFGLLPPLDHQVRGEKPRTLNEAIRFALEFEGKQSARRAALRANVGATQVVSPSVTLNQASPPVAQVCRATVQQTSETIPQQQPQVEQGNGPSQSAQPARALYCVYCKINGHHIDDCFTIINHAKKNIIKNPYARNYANGNNNEAGNNDGSNNKNGSNNNNNYKGNNYRNNYRGNNNNGYRNNNNRNNNNRDNNEDVNKNNSKDDSRNNSTNNQQGNLN